MNPVLTEAQKGLLALVDAARDEARQLAEIARAARQAAEAAEAIGNVDATQHLKTVAQKAEESTLAAYRAVAKAEGITRAVIGVASSDAPTRELAQGTLLAMARSAQTLDSPLDMVQAAATTGDEIMRRAIAELTRERG